MPVVKYSWYVLLVSCATVVTPSGGPKDISPPKPVMTEPQNGAVDCHETHIRITFDEFIQLKDITSQLIVSPPAFNPPDVKLKGKTLLINIKDTLRENTTYTFHFGDAISDITENNILDNYHFAFATGSFMDSLRISGNVKDAFTHEPEKKVWVMLYDCIDKSCDSLPCKALPNYLAKTNDRGEFQIEHVKKGSYLLFALKDQNRNYLYDLPEERIAFYEEMINPTDTMTHHLSLFQEKLRDSSWVDTALTDNKKDTSAIVLTKADSLNGKVKVKIYFPKKDTVNILELLYNKGTVAVKTTITKDTIIEYESLTPGDYRLRNTRDSNGNGKWDTGNYGQKLLPEKVAYYPQTITVRANWEMEVEWEIEY